MGRNDVDDSRTLAYGLIVCCLVSGCASLPNSPVDQPNQQVSQPIHQAQRLDVRDARPIPPEPVRLPTVSTVQYLDVADEAPLPIPPANEESADAEMVAAEAVDATATLPVDLPTALRLAGANNLQIAFAAEQVQQAYARVDAADVIWVPSLNAGVVYNNHAGRIQATEGQVIEASRNSLFVGAGATMRNSPVAAGSGGPARMFVDLALVDALFEPLAARQVARNAIANEAVTFNDTLLTTAQAYLDLVRAYATVAILEEAVSNAEDYVEITADFSRSGQGLLADAERAKAELANRRTDLLAAEESTAVASAALARLLRLDPTIRLLPADILPLPLELVDLNYDVCELIGQAYSLRPELVRSSATVDETWYRVRQEHWCLFAPNLYAGFSSGGFGGAPGASVDDFSDRTDVDVGAIWQFENMGLGNRARRRETNSVHRQAHVVFDQTRDQIAMEVTQAFDRVRYRHSQIGTSEPQVRYASKALKLNLDGIRGGVLRPIEIQQAIDALANARHQHLNAIIEHNRAQFELVRAIGQPVTENSEIFSLGPEQP